MNQGLHWHILELPPEVLAEILAYVDGGTLIQCPLVCKTFRATVQSSVTLCYKTELYVEGFTNNPSSIMSTNERMNLLCDQRRRWLLMDWKRRCPVRLPNRGPRHMGSYDLLGGIIVEEDSGGHLLHSVLPGSARAEVIRNERTLEFRVADLTMDPSQDLLVLLDTQGRVHIRTISTNKVHPLAQKESLLMAEMTEPFATILQVADDMICLMYWWSRVGFMMWNWRTGQMVVDTGSNGGPVSLCCVVFLTSRVFVFADAHRHGSLVFYTLTESHAQGDHCTPFADLVPAARLLLPELKGNSQPGHINFDVGPMMRDVPPDMPFASDPARRVSVLQVAYLDEQMFHVSQRYWMFTHIEHLLSFLAPLEEATGTRIVPWSEWGPEKTRFMEISVFTNQYARFISGQRVVLLSALGSNTLRELIILDFNIHPRHLAVAQALADADAATDPEPGDLDALGNQRDRGAVEIKSAPTRVNYRQFVEPVATHLPFIRSVRQVRTVDTSGYMIDDERLVELQLTLFEDDIESIDVCLF